MRPSLTLFLYLSRHYLIGLFIVFAVLTILGLTLDAVELLRRSAGRPEVGFDRVMVMALLKLPDLSQRLLPFAVLIGGMLSLQRLTRSQELVVARAAGVSVWQFLAPGLALVLLLGTFVVTVYNPIASVLVSRYEELEAKYLKRRTSLLAVSDNGLWLRDVDADGQVVIHALRVAKQGVELSDAILLFYRGNDRFANRIDARTARLTEGFWELDDVLITGPEQTPVMRPQLRVRTALTIDRIQDSFASPETLSFWALPDFIASMERAGFSALRHRMHWHALLAAPFALMALVLVAAPFGLRAARRGGTGLLLASGVIVGFLLHFFSDVIYAFGESGEIPVLLAAWSPPLISTSLGLAMLFYIEEG
jgi:lipopolysaccharide export system permease protein